MRKIAALAEAHYVTVAPHNPMGPLATAVNVHFSAAQPNFRILEYRLPEGPGYGSARRRRDRARRMPARALCRDPYLPKDGYLELRPDRPGWGVEMDEDSGPRRLCPLGAPGAEAAGRILRLRLTRGRRAEAGDRRTDDARISSTR